MNCGMPIKCLGQRSLLKSFVGNTDTKTYRDVYTHTGTDCFIWTIKTVYRRPVGYVGNAGNIILESYMNDRLVRQ